MGVLSILAGLQELALRTLQELAKTTTACSNAMNALDNAKADKLVLHPINVPATEWKKDIHGYYIDLNVPGLTADDCVAVLIEPESNDAAKAAVMKNRSASSEDTLRLRAWKQPTEDLAAHYYLIREDILMAQGPVTFGGESYSLPPATADTLGGVMIGDGLSADETGKAAFTPDNMSVPLQKTLCTQLAGDGLSVDETGKMNVDKTGALACFPVGIVISMVGNTSPAALFGGTWQKIAQDRVLMGASSRHAAGTTVEAGLPDITGSVTAFAKEFGGAFTQGKLVDDDAVGNSGDQVRRFLMQFNASNSNAIYGASSTVQPAAYYVYIWRRVA